jgi:hypothetical protein
MVKFHKSIKLLYLYLEYPDVDWILFKAQWLL